MSLLDLHVTLSLLLASLSCLLQIVEVGVRSTFC